MKIASRLLSFLVILVVVLFATNSYAHHAQYYVLDGFGGVHAGGGAPGVPAGIPYFGFDIAKGIAYVPSGTSLVGDGVLVLDGFGGVHTAGLGGVSPATPYFGFDVARAITYRNIPPRAAGSSASNTVDISAVGAFQVIQSVQITAPDDGYIFVSGSTYLGCFTLSPPKTLAAQISINIDSTAELLVNAGLSTFDDCAYGSGYYATSNQTITHMFSVSPGIHTVNLLGRKLAGTGTARFLGRSLSAIFIDHGATGTSMPEELVDPGAARVMGR